VLDLWDLEISEEAVWMRILNHLVLVVELVAGGHAAGDKADAVACVPRPHDVSWNIWRSWS